MVASCSPRHGEFNGGGSSPNRCPKREKRRREGPATPMNFSDFVHEGGRNRYLQFRLNETNTAVVLVSQIDQREGESKPQSFLIFGGLLCFPKDCKIAERIEREGKGCLIVVNKWDTLLNKNQQTATYYEQDVKEKLCILDWAPVVYSTALAGRSVEKIIMAAITVEKERSRRLTTAVVNQVVQEALAFKSPPRTRGGKRGRIYYCTQAAIRPPTFVFFVNDAKLFPETYRRYMEKQLRLDAGFAGTPIRLLWSNRRKIENDEGRTTTRTTGNLLLRDRKLELAT